jgi:hypothetical protein
MTSTIRRRSTRSKIRTTKQFVKMLYRFFNDSSINSFIRSDVWSILTALRGPDSILHPTNKRVVKTATTGVLRHKIVGDEYIHNIPAVINEDEQIFVNIRNELRSTYNGSDHFLSHIMDAFRAAGLKWNSLNK